MNSAFLKFLQLALLADVEYENAKVNGTATLLAPGNFQASILAISAIFAPAPVAPIVPAA